MIGNKTLWQRWLRRGDSQGRTIVFGLVLSLVALVTYLIFGANPWIAGFFEKVDAGQAMTLADRVAAGGWFGAAINATICLLLVITSGWWMTPSPLAARAANRDASAVWGVSRTSRANDYRGGWWFWVLLILAIGLAGALRFQRLNREFSPLESTAVGEMIRVEESVNASGTKRSLAWQQTLFGLDGNGAQPAGRLSARVLDATLGSSGDDNGELASAGTAAVRGGPFIAGVIAVLVVAMWLRAAGAPLAGVMAGFFLALNPWHLRWSSTVGGYSEALSWLLLAMLMASAALETVRWRWFLLGSFLQALAVLSFSGATAAVVVLVFFLAATLLIRRDGISFGRWLVATCIGAMLVIQILAPVATASLVAGSTPLAAGDSTAEQAEGGIKWIDLWSQASAGGPWKTDESASDDAATVSVKDLGPAGSWIFGMVFPLLAVAGLVGGVARGRIKMTLLLAAIGSCLFFAVRSWSSGRRTQADGDWNALVLCLVFCMALASIIEWSRRSEPLLDRSRLTPKGEGKAAWVVAIVLVVLYTFVTWAPRAALL